MEQPGLGLLHYYSIDPYAVSSPSHLRIISTDTSAAAATVAYDSLESTFMVRSDIG